MALIYKIAERAAWDEACRLGRFVGAPVDLKDGFIHLSAADQVRQTAAKHFLGQMDLLIIAFDPVALGAGLRWEVSRGGALFPHFYGELETGMAAWISPLPLGPDRHHIFPEGMASP